MGYMIIQRKDKQKMSGMVSDMLRATQFLMSTGGELMSCIEEMNEMDERGGMGMREGMDMRGGMGMRDGGRYGMRGQDPGNGYGDRWNPSMPSYYMGERRGNY